jgi:hypothetical protein
VFGVAEFHGSKRPAQAETPAGGGLHIRASTPRASRRPLSGVLGHFEAVASELQDGHYALSMRCAGAVLMTTALLGSCGDGASRPRYSADALSDGVTIEVDDPDNLIQSAVVLLPTDLTANSDLDSSLAGQGVAIVQPGPMGYDAVIVYRTGPYCGLLPDVHVRTGTSRSRLRCYRTRRASATLWSTRRRSV